MYYYGLDLSEYINLSLEGYISIYLSILSIIVSAILAILIYRWEFNDEKKSELAEIKHAKHILKVLLINGTKRAFEVYNNHDEDDFSEFNFIRITDEQIGLIATIGDLLNEDSFLYLSLLMETLKDMADKERNDYLYESRESLKKYIKLITLPFYSLYHFKLNHLDNMYDVMNKDAIKIFNILADTDSKISSKFRIKYNSDGQILFEICSNDYLKVYNPSGYLLCNAIIDDQGIIEGKAKIFSCEMNLEFQGNFKDRQRRGMGTEYFVGWITGEVKRIGIWKNDRLISGKVYKVLLNNNLEIYTINDDEEYIQLYDMPHTLSSFLGYEAEFNVATININNGEIQINKESIIPLVIIAKEAGYYIDRD